MLREKNTSKPIGSGVIVWLHDQVEEHWPEMLLEARQQKNANAWLLERLKTMVSNGDELASVILVGYRARIHADAAERRQRDRIRLLTGYQAQLGNVTGKQLAFIQKQIAKLEKSITKHEDRKIGDIK